LFSERTPGFSGGIFTGKNTGCTEKMRESLDDAASRRNIQERRCYVYLRKLHSVLRADSAQPALFPLAVRLEFPLAAVAVEFTEDHTVPHTSFL